MQCLHTCPANYGKILFTYTGCISDIIDFSVNDYECKYTITNVKMKFKGVESTVQANRQKKLESNGSAD